MLLSVNEGNYASEDHVDGSCEEGWSDEDEERLNDEAWQACWIEVRPDPASITDSLHYGDS